MVRPAPCVLVCCRLCVTAAIYRDLILSITTGSSHVDVLVKGLTFVFMSAGSDHTTRWDDACRLCQKVTQKSHKRSGCRARGDGNHGKNGWFTLKTKPTYNDTQQMFLMFLSVKFKNAVSLSVKKYFKSCWICNWIRTKHESLVLWSNFPPNIIDICYVKTENITSLVMHFF